MLKINTIRNNERMSTQDLLLEIEAACNSAGATHLFRLIKLSPISSEFNTFAGRFWLC